MLPFAKMGWEMEMIRYKFTEKIPQSGEMIERGEGRNRNENNSKSSTDESVIQNGTGF